MDFSGFFGFFQPREVHRKIPRTLLHILAKFHPDPTHFDPSYVHFSFRKIFFSANMKNPHNHSYLAPDRPETIKFELSMKFSIGWTHSHQNPVHFSQFAILLAPLIVTPEKSKTKK